MLLRYVNQEGRQVIIHLRARPAVTLGRGKEADVCVADPIVSRVHCEIRLWHGDYVLKDLKSRNGTHLNEVPVDVAVLKAGDTDRIGSTLLGVEKEPQKGPQTILLDVVQELEAGKKGYGTVLREIVQSTAGKPKSGKRSGG